MTLEELDRKLASWKTDLENISNNLAALEDGMGFKMAKQTQLSGVTDTKVKDAFATVEQLWEYLKLLRNVIDQCVEKRAQMPKVFKGAAIEEIEKLLTGNSVHFPPIQVAHGARDLVQSAQQTQDTTPDRLKQVMIDAYAKPRDLFTQLRQRWLDLAAAYNEVDQKVEALKARVTAIGKPMPAEISDLEARLKTIDKKRNSDPLSLRPEEIDSQLKTYLSKATIRVQQMEREMEQVGEEVKRAYQRLEKVKLARIQAMEVVNRVSETITNSELIKTPAKTKDLAESLDKINPLVAQKKYLEAQTALTAWLGEASRLEATFRECTLENERLLQRCRDLTTRFEKAKKRRENNKDKGLENDRGLDRFAEMYALHTTDKINLVEAEKALASYETRVGELIAQYESAPKDVRLKRRLDNAKAEATELGLSDVNALVKFAEKAEAALSAGDLDKAESMIYSYEVKLGELKTNPPAPRQEPQATPQPPAKSREETLKERLASLRKEAARSGFQDQKALVKFAEKADAALASSDLDTAENMIGSYETKLGELKAQGANQAPASPPAQEATPPSRKEALVERLRKGRATKSEKNIASKALDTFAEKAEQALAADDLETAESMVGSFETKLGELVAKAG